MAEGTSKQLEEYVTADGRSPFIEWLNEVRIHALGRGCVYDWIDSAWVTSVTAKEWGPVSTSYASTMVLGIECILGNMGTISSSCYGVAQNELNKKIFNVRKNIGKTLGVEHHDESIQALQAHFAARAQRS